MAEKRGNPVVKGRVGGYQAPVDTTGMDPAMKDMFVPKPTAKKKKKGLGDIADAVKKTFGIK